MATPERASRGQTDISPTKQRALQEQWFPDGRCFGCGPANSDGFGLRSFPGGRGAVARWQPRPHHQSGLPVVAGGVIGTLLDCHSGAALFLAVDERDGTVPYKDGDPWVTIAYRIDLLLPTRLDHPLQLEAWVEDLEETRAEVRGEIQSDRGPTAAITAEWRKLPPRDR